MSAWSTTFPTDEDRTHLIDNTNPVFDSSLGNDNTSRFPHNRPVPAHIRRKPVPPRSAISGLLKSASSVGSASPTTTPTYSRLTDHDTQNTVENTRQRTSEGGIKHSPDEHTYEVDRSGCCWLPYTLRWYYLLVLLLSTLSILTALIFLHLYSRNNHGLGDDDGESIQFFGWRFAPTLVAVLYSLMCTMVLDDVKRTEPFARLTKANGSSADATVLQQPGAWWNALADGLSTAKNKGSRSWPLVCSATSFIIASLVLSPFSSAFLRSDEVVLASELSFTRLEPSLQSPLEFGDQVVPRFRTISNMLQNVTTSAWVTDQFTVLPFYPSYLSSAPLGATFGVPSEVWHAETTVFTTDLSCKTLHYTAKTWRNLTHFYESNGDTYNQSIPMRSVKLATDDGCTINLTISDGSQFVLFGGTSWARQGVFAISINELTYTSMETGYNMLLNSSVALMDIIFSQECSGDEILLVSDAWVLYNSSDYSSGVRPWNPDLQIGGQICNASYSAANVTVSVNITDSISNIIFDQEEFHNKRHQIGAGADVIDVDQFQENFLSPNWSYHLVAPNSELRLASGGPSAVLTAMYDFSVASILNAAVLVSQATRMKQRYLGEAIMSSLSQWNGPVNKDVSGKLTSIRTRIYVVEGVAFILEAAVLAELFLIMSLYYTTRIERRPLGINSDPARTTTIARLIAHDTATCRQFQSAHAVSPKAMAEEFKGSSFRTVLDRISVVETNSLPRKPRDKSPPVQSKLQDWRPVVLYQRTKIGLAIFLAATLVAVAVLFDLSAGFGLYQKAFVYKVRVTISSNHFTTFAPYSIIPTLVAVGIGLWWSATETELRFLQPFIAMTRRPILLAEGVGLSYRSSYLLWAALKAVLRKHWLLSTLSTGAFLSQILTIGMSALWLEEYGFRNSSLYLQRDLELRALPNLFEATYIAGTHAWTAADTTAVALRNLYGSLKTNWLYSGIIQVSLNGTEPPWSSDGWSFVKVDLSQIGQSADGSGDVNVTVTTPAIRAQLECSPYDDSLSNLTNWLTPRDFTNSSVWNVTNNPANLTTGYTFGCGGISGYMIVQATPGSQYACDAKIATSVFAHNLGIQCCENGTADGPGDAVVAYWSPNLYHPDRNFTVKWIHGQPVSGVQLVNVTDESYLAWPEAPKVAALNCMPVMQKANASVTVDQRSGRVQSYSILDTIQDDGNAWIDEFELHTYWYPNGLANVTVSHGFLFTKALLGAADLSNLAGDADVFSYSPNYALADENTRDLTFNFRLPGLNMDYMSYSIYSMANGDAKAPLEHSRLAYYANRTFSTFFQHYVSSNTTFQDGGWAYQKIGATLPPNSTSGAVANMTYIVNPDRRIEAILSTRVKLLRMSPLAAWLCMSILLWLIVTITMFILVEKKYFATMRRGVSTIADVAILIAGSRSLLNYVQNRDDGQLDQANLRTKLGWFKDQEGYTRWGIELVGDENGVDWLDDDFEDGMIRAENKSRNPHSDPVESIPMIRMDRTE